MKARFLGVVVVAITGVMVLLLTPAHAAEYHDVVVKVDDAPMAEQVADGTGATFVKHVSTDTVVLSAPGTSPEDAAARIAWRDVIGRDVIEWAEPDKPYHAARAANDPCYVSNCAGRTQWGLHAIGVSSAWDVVTGDSSVKVAVLDSGIDVNHPDLAGHVVNGPNYSADPDMIDRYGHGTHVAGTLGASTNNSIGIAGVVWNAQVTSIKVLDQHGSGTSSTVAAGIRWAADNGMRVANLSLVGDATQSMYEAVNYAHARGMILVAAAGNSGSDEPRYPAAFPGVVSVGAATEGNVMAGFSNRGTWVDVLAPGTNIVSSWPANLKPGDPYSIETGTSMATPFVTGAIVLSWSSRPYLSTEGVIERVLGTATPVSGSGTLVTSGRLDVASALAPMPAGYRLAAGDGGIFAFGASYSGSMGGIALNRPIVAMASSGKPDGYWLVGSDGGVFSFGATYYGSAGGLVLNRPVVGASATRSGRGYWLVARDGGVFGYGDALFHGSTGGQTLNKPVVSMVPTATGRGYWLIGADGGVFSFGDARFYGSTGAMSLNAPIVGGARTPSGDGYWLVGADGGVYAFGDAVFHGSAGSLELARPVVAVTPTQSGHGYYLTASDGGVFSYGDAAFRGSTGGQPLNEPVVAITSAP